MDETGPGEPDDTREPDRRDPDRDDPDRPGWAAPSPPGPPQASPQPPGPGAAPPWSAEPTPPAGPPASPPPAPPPASAWGTTPGPPPPAWGTPPPAPPAWGGPPQQPPSWSAPVPPGAGAAAGKRRGWGWLWALIVGLVVLTGVAIAAVVVAVGAFTKPADATNAYLRDLRAGQYAAAYAHLCDARRAETSLGTFRADQQSRGARDEIDEFDVYYSFIHGSGRTATTRYTINRFLTRERWEVDLVKESGQWRLCHFTQVAY